MLKNWFFSILLEYTALACAGRVAMRGNACAACSIYEPRHTRTLHVLEATQRTQRILQNKAFLLSWRTLRLRDLCVASTAVGGGTYFELGTNNNSSELSARAKRSRLNQTQRYPSSPTTAATNARSPALTESRLNFFAAAAMRVSAAATVIGGLVSPFFARWKRTGLMRATT